MFNKEYFFHGRHAERVDKLTSKFAENANTKMFQRNLDIYMLAPLVGFLYGRKADIETGMDRTINYAQMSYEKDKLIYIYRLIMLLDDKYEPNEEKRIDKAFKYFDTDEAIEDEKLYDSYVRGGVDVLYEKLIESGDNYLYNLYDFLEEFDDKYNCQTTTEDILNLARNYDGK